MNDDTPFDPGLDETLVPGATIESTNETPLDSGLDETLAPSSENVPPLVSSTHPTDPLVGRLLDERYRVEKVLGGGGFGMVYMGVQLRLDNRPCVIKVARPELAQDEQFAARFEREKRAMMSLQSRNTVQIIDYGRTDDAIDYIVMEFIDGKELADVLHPAHPMDQRRVLHIARGMCNSLEEAHGAGILHRDLKPGNVMLVDLGNVELVKVIDFGIARLGGSDDGDFKTKTGEMPGTPAYSSFEQLMGQSDKVDERTDIYSMGAMLYEMLTGVVPFGDVIRSRQFDSRTLYFVALAQAKATRNPTPIDALRAQREVHPELRELVFRMLDRSSINRPRDMKEIQAALTRIERALADTTATFDDGVEFAETALPDSMSLSELATKVETPPQTIQPASKKKTLWAGLGIGGGLVAVAVAVFLAVGNGGNRDTTPAASPGETSVPSSPTGAVVIPRDVVNEQKTIAPAVEDATSETKPAEADTSSLGKGEDEVVAPAEVALDVVEIAPTPLDPPTDGTSIADVVHGDLVAGGRDATNDSGSEIVSKALDVVHPEDAAPVPEEKKEPKVTVKKNTGGTASVKKPKVRKSPRVREKPKAEEKPKVEEKPEENMSDKMELM